MTVEASRSRLPVALVSRRPALLVWCGMLSASATLALSSCSREEKPRVAPEALSVRASAAAQEVTPTRVRPAVHAGSWYPKSADELHAALRQRLAAQASPNLSAPVVALVAPHAGLRFSGEVAAGAYRALAPQSVSRVFVLAPAHRQAFSGVALPAADLAAYATPIGELGVDQSALSALRGQPDFAGPANAQDAEHSIEMQAIFIAEVAPKARLVPLLVGHLEDDAAASRIGARLRSLLRPGDVIVVSSDFTHYGQSYGYLPFADDVPNRLGGLASDATQALMAVDTVGFARHLERTHDTICGREPLRILLATLAPGARGQRIALDTSGRQLSDYTSSVTYVGLVYTREGGWTQADVPAHNERVQAAPAVVLDPEGQAAALRMVRQTLAATVKGGEPPAEQALSVPPAHVWRDPYAVFVTLKKHGQLRGCIGHIEAVQELWRDIRDNAVAAALHDPRFTPVRPEELGELTVEVSVLTPTRLISGPDAFEVGRHGIILALRGRRAVFLPQVPEEQGWDRSTTLSHLAVKAGLSANDWRDPEARFSVFEAQVFGEKH